MSRWRLALALGLLIVPFAALVVAKPNGIVTCDRPVCWPHRAPTTAPTVIVLTTTTTVRPTTTTTVVAPPVETVPPPSMTG